MAARGVAVAVAVALVLAGGAAAAYVGGVGPFQSSSDGGDVGPFPTETPTPSGDGSGTGTDAAATSGDGGTTTTDAEQAKPPFTFRVVKTQNCGRTCRDVTVALTNNRNDPARDVSVYVRIFAGNTTSSDARIWQAREAIGRVGAGETVTRTKRVNLGLMEALSVQQNGGWITIQTTVQSAEQTQTFTERRDVT